MTAPEEPELLFPGEVAAILRVTSKTVAKWAAAGKLKSIRTPGGTRRYLAADIAQILKDQEQSP